MFFGTNAENESVCQDPLFPTLCPPNVHPDQGCTSHWKVGFHLFHQILSHLKFCNWPGAGSSTPCLKLAQVPSADRQTLTSISAGSSSSSSSSSSSTSSSSSDDDQKEAQEDDHESWWTSFSGILPTLGCHLQCTQVFSISKVRYCGSANLTSLYYILTWLTTNQGLVT